MIFETLNKAHQETVDSVVADHAAGGPEVTTGHMVILSTNRSYSAFPLKITEELIRIFLFV